MTKVFDTGDNRHSKTEGQHRCRHLGVGTKWTSDFAGPEPPSIVEKEESNVMELFVIRRGGVGGVGFRRTTEQKGFGVSVSFQ